MKCDKLTWLQLVLMYIVYGLCIIIYYFTNLTVKLQSILFITMQNALAVGETQEIKENAELTTLKLRVSSN